VTVVSGVSKDRFGLILKGRLGLCDAEDGGRRYVPWHLR
jgi:hypothetical protein